MLPAMLCIGKLNGLLLLSFKITLFYNSAFINIAEQPATAHVQRAVQNHSLRKIAVYVGMAMTSVLCDTVGDISKVFLCDTVGHISKVFLCVTQWNTSAKCFV
jgi:hypothetical protein